MKTTILISGRFMFRGWPNAPAQAAGPIVFDCQQSRNPGLACSRMVGLNEGRKVQS
jgi:hypothetical protein